MLLIAIGAAMWGTDGVLRYPLTQGWQPATIVFYEHIALTLMVLPILMSSWRAIRTIPARGWVAVLAVAWGGSAIATLLFTSAYQGGNPDVVILLQKTQPLWAVATAAIVLGERPRALMAPVAVVALCGAYLLSFGWSSPADAFAGAAGRSALLALAAAAIWGAATVFGRVGLRHADPTAFTALRFACALPLLAVIAAAQTALPPPHGAVATDYVRILVLALLTGLVGMWLYYRGLRRTPASVATFAELAYPATAVVLNAIFLGQTINSVQVIGFIVIALAIGCLHWVPVRERPDSGAVAVSAPSGALA